MEYHSSIKCNVQFSSSLCAGHTLPNATAVRARRAGAVPRLSYLVSAVIGVRSTSTRLNEDLTRRSSKVQGLNVSTPVESVPRSEGADRVSRDHKSNIRGRGGKVRNPSIQCAPCPACCACAALRTGWTPTLQPPGTAGGARALGTGMRSVETPEH